MMTEKQRALRIASLTLILDQWVLLKSVIHGSLVSQINEHGAIQKSQLESALKRIRGEIKSARSGMFNDAVE